MQAAKFGSNSTVHFLNLRIVLQLVDDRLDSLVVDDSDLDLP
jgi:hypothetical protein